MLIYKNSASNNRPQYEALGNKYRVGGFIRKSLVLRSIVWKIGLFGCINIYVICILCKPTLQNVQFEGCCHSMTCLIPVSQLFNWIQKKYLLNKRKIFAPNVGFEPTTLRLRVSCSTDWASRARWCTGVCKFTIAQPSSSDRCDAWERWIDNFDQTKAHSSFREALFKPCCYRRILVFIGGDHFVRDETLRFIENNASISWVIEWYLLLKFKNNRFPLYPCKVFCWPEQ